MYSGLLPLLLTPNLVSIPILLTIIIFLVPHRPVFSLSLWIYLAFWTMFYFPISRPYIDRGIADSLGEAVIYLINLPIAIGILIWIAVIVTKISTSDRPFKIKKKPTELVLLNKFIVFLYGILFSIWVFLWFADFLEKYSPAWEAYTIIVIFSLSLLLLFNLSTKNVRLKIYIYRQQIQHFVYSFLLAIISLIVVSFSFALTAMVQTKKTIGRYANLDAKYCIQYMKIDTWLDLTPLTAWNKGSGYWGAGRYRAVLVIKVNENLAHLYNWSYKFRKWQYITKGFTPNSLTIPENLECTLEKDFIARVPFIVPKINSFYVGEQEIKIPPQYFPEQENYLFGSVISDRERRKTKTVDFLATTPNFNSFSYILTKLPGGSRLKLARKVSIYPLINKNDLKTIFNIRASVGSEQINPQYNLEKIVFDQRINSIPPKTRKVYYQNKNGIINTAIECHLNSQKKFNCRHSFIHNDLIFTFNHREKDLKQWRKLQTNLINQIKRWQNE